MICDKCLSMVRLEAMSSGECENCLTPVYTPQLPCDILCVNCSMELNRCKSCGNKLDIVKE